MYPRGIPDTPREKLQKTLNKKTKKQKTNYAQCALSMELNIGQFSNPEAILYHSHTHLTKIPINFLSRSSSSFKL